MNRKIEEEKNEEIKREVLKRKNEWAIDVLKENFPDSDLSSKLNKREGLDSVREELLDRGIFLTSESSGFHAYIIQVDVSEYEKSSKKDKAISVVTGYASNGVVDTQSLIEDERVNVLGEFEMGVLSKDKDGNINPTVRSSKEGTIDKNDSKQRQGNRE